MRTTGNYIISTALSLILSVAALAAPRLEMPEASFDFGFTPQNSTISHKFWLKSSGEDSLLILKVVPG